LATIANLLIKIGADIENLKKGMTEAQNKVNKTADAFKKAGTVMTMGVTAPILAAGAASFKMASDVAESVNKVEVAFQKNADEVQAWAKTTLSSIGLAEGTALDMAANFGDMATSMGKTTEEAAKMSIEMVNLAGDMASFKNIPIAEANTALTAVFTGETESLKRLGIVMTETNLQAFALSRGIQENIADMDQATKVQLRYEYVMEMTKNSQGDFARTQEGAANQMRMYTEGIKELSASLGEQLLPIITPIIAKLNSMVQTFAKMDDEQKKTILTSRNSGSDRPFTCSDRLCYQVHSGYKKRSYSAYGYYYSHHCGYGRVKHRYISQPLCFGDCCSPSADSSLSGTSDKVKRSQQGNTQGDRRGTGADSRERRG